MKIKEILQESVGSLSVANMSTADFKAALKNGGADSEEMTFTDMFYLGYKENDHWYSTVTKTFDNNDNPSYSVPYYLIAFNEEGKIYAGMVGTRKSKIRDKGEAIEFAKNLKP